jgi:3',5'-cyclic AMP phosphodiesterase CpdA
VDNIIFHKEPAENYIVVITGDLVEKPTDPSNYEEAKMYISKLENAGFAVLVVPGNHDYGPGSWGMKKYVKQFKETFFGDPDIQYPKPNIIDDIAFIGLDSMAEELNWHDQFFAEGELGKTQLEDLVDILNDSSVKKCKYRVVYLHHHPFHPRPFHHLRDSDKLGKILQQFDISALLYGHNHFGKKHNGKWKIPRCYDGGSATRKEEDDAYPHRVIDLSRDPRWDYDGEFLTPCPSL